MDTQVAQLGMSAALIRRRSRVQIPSCEPQPSEERRHFYIFEVIKMAVNKLVVLGKEINLPVELSEEEVKSNLISLLRDLDPQLADELENTEYTVRVEQNTAVVYRTGAVFG